MPLQACPSMNSQEQRARTTALAQALENADPRGRLVNSEQRELATQAALQASRSRAAPGGSPMPDDELIYLRSQALVKSATAANPALALLQRPRPWWSWLAAGVPVLALLLGVATDRVGNPHRVDLLSLPLLGVIAWNLMMYTWLAAALFWHPQPGQGAAARLAALRRWLNSKALSSPALAERSRSGLAEAAAAFYLQWHSLTAELTLYRCKKVLHLSAAAWGAGIALSLAGRGLVVEYQVGWESTFLQAQHVHAILAALFWPLTLFFPIAPFTVDEVAALRNFAVPGRGAERWVYLYAGLLLLVVVLPRLLLAGWAAWRAKRLSAALHIDMEQPYYQQLLVKLRPTFLAVGLVTGDARMASRLLRLLQQSADNLLAPDPAITSAEGDRLLWLEEPGAGQPVDVVLQIPHELHLTPVPHAWDTRPVATLRLERLGKSWPQMPVIFETVARALPTALRPGLTRLRREWEQRSRQSLKQSMAAISRYLLNAARLPAAHAPAQAFVQARDQLLLQLFELHRLDAASGRALQAKLAQRYLGASGSQGGLGKPTASAAGAAAGATMGGAIDLATAGLTLGAAAALGGLLGAGVGWAFAALKNKGQGAEPMLALTEAALLLYLEVANGNRIQATEADTRMQWQAAIAVALKPRRKALELIWSKARDGGGSEDADLLAAELAALLCLAAQSMLDALYPPAVIAQG
jgi:hypothetical protein